MIKQLSQIGVHHAQANGENQDALCYGKSKDLCVISLADGVSTCREAKRGAQIASQAITNLFLKKGDHFLEFEKEQIADFAVSHILCELKQETLKSSNPVEDFSSTVASVLVDRKNKRMLCFNLGDGIILGAGNGTCKILSMPGDSSSGCCVTTTRRAEKMASVKLCDVDFMDSVVICSDGAWKKMFQCNRLKPEVASMISGSKYDALKEYLISQNCFDDYSFISLDMRQLKRRRCA